MIGGGEACVRITAENKAYKITSIKKNCLLCTFDFREFRLNVESLKLEKTFGLLYTGKATRVYPIFQAQPGLWICFPFIGLAWVSKENYIQHTGLPQSLII